jgi:hypothetical protein
VVRGGGLPHNQKKNAGAEVRMEQVARRDRSVVTASGKIEPKTRRYLPTSPDGSCGSRSGKAIREEGSSCSRSIR